MSENPEKPNAELVKIDQTLEVSTYDFLQFNDLEAFKNYATHIQRSEFSNFATVDDVMTACLWARDKKLPIIDCIMNLVVVNGKVGADGHLIKAQIQRAGINDETIEDYIPLYSYTSKTTTFSQDEIDAAPDKFEIYFSMEAVQAAATAKTLPAGKTPVIRSPKPVDTRTTIKFSRWVKDPRGEWFLRTEYGVFKYSEAIAAELTTKDNWKKYPKDMCYWRAYTRGGRRIADDVLHGTYHKDEIVSILQSPYEGNDVEDAETY